MKNIISVIIVLCVFFLSGGCLPVSGADAPQLNAGSGLVFSRFDAAAARLILELKAFPGHETRTEIISPLRPEAVFVNGKNLEGWKQRRENGVYLPDVLFPHQTGNDTVAVQY